ncbi:hypothetical protein GQ44DRAFT_621776 [Phaeosphaeriaceae sp. PMI808]|nr:hypothetical protein GQ44DRAFT_621776 [Phaeosphaeriaceae sp. PMI808]
MSVYTGLEDPKAHPDNANLPNVNEPATILGLTISMLGLAMIAITLRLWVRLRDRIWGWDDAFVLLAGLSSVVGDTMVCLMPADGLGLHLWTLRYPMLVSYFKHVYVTNLIYCASATFIKLAILFQYLRLFAEASASTSTTQYRLARLTTISLIVLSSVWGLIFLFLAIFPCKPVSKHWDIMVTGSCFGWGAKDPNVFYPMFAAHSASNMFLDLLVLVVPIPFLGMLRLAGKSKAGLITLFSMGTLICALSIGRLVSFCVTRAGTMPRLDMTYYTPVIYMFSVLEVNIAIIAASIPIFWPVIATMATNKIWVVNEIEIRVENNSNRSVSTQGDINLVEQGLWSKLDGKEDLSPDNRTNRLSVLTKAYDRTDTRSYNHKQSTSIGRKIELDLSPRYSHESQRNLCRTRSEELAAGNGTIARTGSLSTSERNDWFAEVDRQNSGARVRRGLFLLRVGLRVGAKFKSEFNLCITIRFFTMIGMPLVVVDFCV